MEAYKLFKDCKDQKIAFSTLAYLEGNDKVCKKVIAHFLNLDLAFLDEDSKATEEPTHRAQVAANPHTRLPKVYVFYFYFHVHSFDLLLSKPTICNSHRPTFCNSLQAFLEILMKFLLFIGRALHFYYSSQVFFFALPWFEIVRSRNRQQHRIEHCFRRQKLRWLRAHHQFTLLDRGVTACGGWPKRFYRSFSASPRFFNVENGPQLAPIILIRRGSQWLALTIGAQANRRPFETRANRRPLSLKPIKGSFQGPIICH